jgi:hypothetical protein
MRSIEGIAAMSSELLAAIIVGLVTALCLGWVFWRILVGYDYPEAIDGNRVAELRYTIQHREYVVLVWRLAIGLPFLTGLGAYLIVEALQKLTLV